MDSVGNYEEKKKNLFELISKKIKQNCETLPINDDIDDNK